MSVLDYWRLTNAVLSVLCLPTLWFISVQRDKFNTDLFAALGFFVFGAILGSAYLFHVGAGFSPALPMTSAAVVTVLYAGTRTWRRKKEKKKAGHE